MLDPYNVADYGRRRHQEIIENAAQRRKALKILKANSENDTLTGRIRTAVLSAIITLG